MSRDYKSWSAQEDLNDARDEISKLEATNDALVEALEPFAAFADAFEAKPLSGLDDVIYKIHAGTEWEASIRRSDCNKARAAIKTAKQE